MKSFNRLLLFVCLLVFFLLADKGQSFVWNQALRISLVKRPKIITKHCSFCHENSSAKKEHSSLLYATTEQNLDNDHKSSWRRRWLDFRTGVSYVHNNYLDIYWTIFSRVLAVEATLMIGIGITHFVSPYLETLAVSTLVNTLKGLAFVSTLYQIPCLLLLMVPFVVAFYGIFILGVLVPRLLTRLLVRTRSQYCLALALSIEWLLDRTTLPAYRSIIRWNEASQSASFQLSIQEFFQKPGAQFSLLVLIGPVLEEFLFRFMFDRFQGRLGRLFKSGRSSNDTRSEVGEAEAPDRQAFWFQRYKPWVLISSVLFAASHFSNWYPNRGSILMDDFMGAIVDPSDVGRLVSAVFQMTVALTMSLEVFTPLYMRAGVFTSIGAHMAWNCFSMFAFLNIALRLLWKAF